MTQIPVLSSLVLIFAQHLACSGVIRSGYQVRVEESVAVEVAGAESMRVYTLRKGTELPLDRDLHGRNTSRTIDIDSIIGMKASV